ncbi:helix-turn-helix transcriptional regulator [candidate division WOR-3 bacterium]|nr:helix-turn-helix transcriptional regulator [candidate division WOR-3 bacterium]
MVKNFLKVWRAKFDLTQEDLAKNVGVTRQTIIAIEKGDYNPSVELALKISIIFKTNVEEIFYLMEEK